MEPDSPFDKDGSDTFFAGGNIAPSYLSPHLNRKAAVPAAKASRHHPKPTPPRPKPTPPGYSSKKALADQAAAKEHAAAKECTIKECAATKEHTIKECAAVEEHVAKECATAEKRAAKECATDEKHVAKERAAAEYAASGEHPTAESHAVTEEHPTPEDAERGATPKTAYTPAVDDDTAASTRRRCAIIPTTASAELAKAHAVKEARAKKAAETKAKNKCTAEDEGNGGVKKRVRVPPKAGAKSSGRKTS